MTIGIGLGVKCGSCGCSPPPDCECYCGGYRYACNPCCTAKCMPCEMSISVSPGNTWSGTNVSLLTSADKTELRNYVSSNTWVGSGSWGQVDWRGTSGGYVYLGPGSTKRWAANVQFRTGGESNCSDYGYWLGGFYSGLASGSYLSKNDSGAGTAGIATLASGKILNAVSFLLGEDDSSARAPFKFSDWCGSSFSLTYNAPATPSGSWNFLLTDPSTATSSSPGTYIYAVVDGTTVTLSW